jgi:hypothetical protein
VVTVGTWEIWATLVTVGKWGDSGDSGDSSGLTVVKVGTWGNGATPVTVVLVTWPLRQWGHEEMGVTQVTVVAWR